MTGYFSPNAAQDALAPVRGALARRPVAARVLRYGPALVSLSALMWAAPALAQTTSTTLSSSSTTPLVTSTAGDVTINTGVTLHPPSGAAVTIDSNNSVTNNGTIQFQNLNNVVGIAARGGFAGTISNNGAIEVDDTSTTTTDSNGIVHGPFANGTNRFGIQVTGLAPFTGDIDNSGAASITVKGDNSAGISVETNLTGTLLNAGSISVAGVNSFGIRTLGTIGKGVTLSGTMVASGQGAQGASLGGDVTGQVLINGSVTTTGYRYTTRSTDTNFLSHLTADDLFQSGPAVTIAGNVTGGVLLDSTSTTDASGNVSVAAGSISSIAAAPALVIGGATGKNIVLGNVDAGAGTDPYGLSIRGSIVGNGVYDNISSTAVQLGVANGGTVNTTGGIHVSGAVSASAYAASATAFSLSGVIAPVFRNDGSIEAVINSDAAGAAAQALVIQKGSTVSALQNANVISSTVSGQQADSVAIVDHSGTLSEVENIGQISTARGLTSTSTPVTGRDVAIDLSANTTGAHLLQDAPTGDTFVPSITGSVLLGSGADRVEILAGAVVGNVDLGAGANSLTIDNGASVTGNLDAAGGTIAMTVGKGSLQINDASQLKLTSLSLGSTSSLIVTADPSLGRATSLNVAGSANIASGATIGVRLANVLTGSATYTLIQANQLTAGTVDTALLGSTPFLYNTALSTNTAAGTVSATLTRKTAAQLGLPTTSAGGYEPLISVLSQDPGLEGALLSQTTQAGTIGLYNQLMPNHSGALFNAIATSVAAFSRPLDDRQDPVGGGFWMQETNSGLFADGRDNDPGYKAWSFGAVAGYEIPRTPLGILGVTFGASTNEVYPDDRDSAADLHANVVDAGVYWRMTKGGFSANARVGIDYARISSDRVIEVLGGDGLAVTRSANGSWGAFGFNARGMASYEARFGNYYVRPLMSLDYMRLNEGSYTESGGGNVMDLSVGSRTSSRLSTFAGVAVGALYGPDHSWGPEALIGYKGVANEVLGVTTARFVGGGDAFTLRSDEISGSGAAVHLSVRGENGSGGFAVETGAEARDGLNIYDLRLTGHVQF
ncbi:MAG: autotransporter domain-containing protein [Phenylobacterium sp.]